jgi:hypothetical protein
MGYDFGVSNADTRVSTAARFFGGVLQRRLAISTAIHDTAHLRR